MKVLEKFWYGNIAPTEHCAPSSKECHETLKLISRNEKIFWHQDREQKKLFSQ